MNRSRVEVQAFLSGWYSCKLQGHVVCDYDPGKRKYCISGNGLPMNPTHPQYNPRGWGLIDYITPARARKLMEHGEQWYDIAKMYP